MIEINLGYQHHLLHLGHVIFTTNNKLIILYFTICCLVLDHLAVLPLRMRILSSGGHFTFRIQARIKYSKVWNAICGWKQQLTVNIIRKIFYLYVDYILPSDGIRLVRELKEFLVFLIDPDVNFSDGTEESLLICVTIVLILLLMSRLCFSFFPNSVIERL